MICSSLFRLALLLTTVFLPPVALIRAQPYDNSELRAFLTPPDDCPTPCFMGIRPGVTTADQAIAIMEHHEWVAGVRRNERGGFSLVWDWNGKQPAWIKTPSEGHVRLMPGRDTVESIAIDSNIRIGDLYLLLGLPDKVSIQRLEGDCKMFCVNGVPV